MAKNLGHDLQDYGDIQCPLPQNTTDKPSRIGHVIEFNKQVRTVTTLSYIFDIYTIFVIFPIIILRPTIHSLAVIGSWALTCLQKN